MGVTLERVQNKFACIIGELCSEPDILSQFAIWVDLRIAEYKAKGAISLECTGDDPNPNWLRGHKKSILKRKLRGMPGQTEPLHHTESYREESTQEADERLSPDIVIVKNEPDTDIFPVNVHINANSSVNAVSSSRKRSSTDFYPREHSDLTSQSHCKVQRLSPSPNVLEPMNQSLMSIISQCELLDESGDVSGSTGPAQDSSCVTDMGDNSICMPSTSTDSAEHPDNNRTAGLRERRGHPPWNSSRSGGRRGVYKTYTEARMIEALAVVQAGKLNQKAASRVFDIPLRTLTYRLRKLHNEAVNDRGAQTIEK